MIEAASATGPIVGVGLSLWGPMLVKLVAAYPALLHKLVLISSNPSFNVLNASQAWLDEFRQLLKQGHKEPALRLLASIQYPEPEAGPLIEQGVRASLSTPTDFLLHRFAPDPEDDVVSSLPHIQVPTLVMHGTADRRAPFEGARYLAEHILGAQLYAF